MTSLAKKRKREEEAEFQVPEFDRTAFMWKEIEAAKAALVTIAYAFVIGLISYSLTVLGYGYAAAPLGLLALYGLRHVYPYLKLDTSKFDRKTWLGNGAIFIFAWLAFWVLLLNPPFLDISPPVIQQVMVPGAVPENLSPGVQASLSLGTNSSFQITVLAQDNVRLERVEITVDSTTFTMTALGNDEYSYTVQSPQIKVYEFQVVAVDHRGLRSGDFNFLVSVSP